MHGKQRLEEKTAKFFHLFINKMGGLSPDQVQGVRMNNIPSVEGLLILNILLYDIDFVHDNNIGELARRGMKKYKNTVTLLRYKSHSCYVSTFNAVFQAFRCPNCDTCFNRTFNLEQKLTTCSERVKNVQPKNVYQTHKTLFDKLDSSELNTLMCKHFSRT